MPSLLIGKEGSIFYNIHCLIIHKIARCIGRNTLQSCIGFLTERAQFIMPDLVHHLSHKLASNLSHEDKYHDMSLFHKTMMCCKIGSIRIKMLSR